MVRQAIERGYNGQWYWVIADIANHTLKKGRHYFDPLEKCPAETAFVAKLATRYGRTAPRTGQAVRYISSEKCRC